MTEPTRGNLVNPLKFVIMKNLIVILISLFSLNAVQAQHVVKETITVSGNCGMCKKNIENSIKKDVKSAVWNKDTKVLTVKYDSDKISRDQIEQKIAAAGYDTEKYKASDAAYAKLNECCQYTRKE